jgi:hypothetical protein
MSGESEPASAFLVVVSAGPSTDLNFPFAVGNTADRQGRASG